MSDKLSPWVVIEPVKKQIHKAMCVSVLSVLSSMFALYFLAHVVSGWVGLHQVRWAWFFTACVLAVFAFFLRGLSFRQSHVAAFELEPILRTQLLERISKASLGLVGQQGSAALSKIVQDDVKGLHVFVADSTPLYARVYAGPLISLLFLVYIDWRLALVALSVLVIGMLVLSWVMSDSKEMSEQYNQAREDVHRSVVEYVQAMPVVRAYDGGQSSFIRYEKALDHYKTIVTAWFDKNGAAAKLSMVILNPMPTLLALLWAGAYWFWQDSLSFSDWLAVLLLGTGMAEALMPFMSLYHLNEQVKISVDRIQQILDLPTLAQTKTPVEPKDASVVFEQVSFCYETRSENAISDVSFTVPSGSFTALVGASGAGKSTIAQLVPRFWDVTQGAVKVGQQDVRDIALDDLMQRVAFVFQDDFLFSGTLADNIKLGSPHARLDDVMAAAKSAQIDEFIQTLPEGYDTQVGERGARLSGGQRQRITIARAILQNRPILVLDEATAFADAENEALIMKALHHLMKGKTVLMIAHRLPTIAHADQILVFDKGHLVEQGSNEELISLGGVYAKLWESYQRAQNWRIQAN